MKRILLYRLPVLILILFLFGNNRSSAQSFAGKDFWFGYMTNFTENDPTQVYQVTIASEVANSGTISVPQMGYSVPFTVGANSSIQVFLPKANVSNFNSNATKRKTGVHVVSAENCVVYAGNNQEATSDESVIIPTPGLGKIYDIVAYSHKVNGESVFLIVATEDNTKVTYNLNSGHATSDVRFTDVTITLNKGETFQLMWGYYVYFLPPNYLDFTGSTVVADKPIAVFGGSSCSWVGDCEACDHLFEQLLPINKWANNFTIVPSKVRNTIPPNDIARIYAHENSNVLVNGLSFNINAQEYLDLELKTPLSVSSNKPVNVTQYLTGTGCNGYGKTDPSAFMVLPSEQYASSYIFATSAFTRFVAHSATIIINTTKVSTLRLNGIPLTATFTPIAGTTQSYGYITLAGGSQYKLLSNDNTPFGLVVYGVGTDESYAYSAGGNLQNFCELVCSDVTICAGQTATLNVSSPKLGTSPTFQWFKVPTGGALQGTGSSFTTPALFTTDSFYVQISSPSCNNDRLKVKVNVKPVATSAFTVPASVCLNKSATITYTGTGITSDTYTWDFNGGVIDAGTGKGPYTIHWDSPGVKNISLTVTKDGCASTVTTKSITVNDLPIVDLAKVNPLCFNSNTGSITANASGGTGALSYSLDNVTYQSSNIFNNLPAGTYTVYVKDNVSCSVNKTISLSNPNKLAIAGTSKAAACGVSDGEIHVTASGGTGTNHTYKIDTVGAVFKANGDFINLAANTYKIIIKDENGCTKDSVFSVQNLNGPTLSLSVDKSILLCNGDSNAVITASASGSTGPFSYKLNDRPAQDTVKFTKVPAGIHNVIVTDKSTGCIDIKKITITEPSKIAISEILVKDAFCDEANGSIEITAAGGTGSLKYSINGVDFQPENIFNNLNPSNFPNGITVNIKDDNNCAINGSASIKQLGKPNVTAVSDKTTICKNGKEQAQLSASNAVSYAWTPAAGLNDASAASPFANPDTTTTYTVVGTDERGCTNSASVTVLVDQPLSPPVITCGTSTTTSVTFNWAAVSKATDYEISLDGGNTWIVPSSGTTGLSHQMTGLQPNTDYTISVRALGVNSCGNSAATVKTCRTLSCSITSKIASAKSTICLGDTVQLFGSSNQTGVTYKWIPATGLSNDKIANPIASPKSTITYTLTVSDAVCESSTQKTIGVKKLANATFAHSKDGLKVNFYADSSNEISKYFWDYGDRSKNDSTKNTNHEFLTPGTYDVTLIVSNSCNSDTMIFPLVVKDGVKDSVGPLGLDQEVVLENNSFSIFPNPYSDNLNIQLNLESSSKVGIVLMDLLGREVYSKSYTSGLNKGMHMFNISANEFEVSGNIVLVKLIIDNKVYIRKIIKH